MTHYLISDGTQFAPRVSKDAVLYAYSPEICRYDNKCALENRP